MTTTTNLGIVLPTPGVTTNWGATTTPGLNFVIQQIDNVFAATGSGTPVGLFVNQDASSNPQTLKIGTLGTFSSAGTNLFGVDGASGTVAGNTIRSGNASGSDTVGGSLTISAGNSTGNAAGGSILMQVAAAGPSSGTGANTLRNV